MATMHWRSSITLGLLSLGVALAGCQSPDTTPTSTPIAAAATIVIPTTTPSSIPVATPTVEPIAVPPSVTPPPIASATVQPTVTPDLPTVVPTILSAAPFRTADRLPVNQPWLLVEESEICGTSASGYALIAIDRAGGRTKLNRPITTLATRPGLPPLLATCTDDGTIAIVDPVRWKSVRIALKPGRGVSQFVVSPDGKQAIFEISCLQDDQCLANGSARLQVANLQTGATHPFIDYVEGLGLVAWKRNGLYVTTEHGRTNSPTLDLLDPADPRRTFQTLGQVYSYGFDNAHEQWSRLLNNNTGLILSNLHQNTTQTIEDAPWISDPAFAPDGTALTYFREVRAQTPNAPPHYELVVFDITKHTKTVLLDTLEIPFAITRHGALMPSTLWSQDGQRIVIGTQASAAPELRQASLLTRDGTLLNTLALPDGQAWEITDNDQLIWDSGEGQGVTWMPLRAGATPYAPSVLTVGYISAVILPASSGGAPPPVVPTRAVLLPVTQLPTPIAPTSTPT